MITNSSKDGQDIHARHWPPRAGALSQLLHTMLTSAAAMYTCSSSTHRYSHRLIGTIVVQNSNKKKYRYIHQGVFPVLIYLLVQIFRYNNTTKLCLHGPYSHTENFPSLRRFNIYNRLVKFTTPPTL